MSDKYYFTNQRRTFRKGPKEKNADLELEELAQLIGESPQVVVVEHQFPQIAELPNLSRQGPQLVVRQVQPPVQSKR